MRFKSFCDLSRDIQVRLLPQLPRDISIVYGIPRSGMVPATIVATTLGATLASVGGPPAFGSRRKHKILPEGGKSLLIDDSIHTGKAMSAAIASLGGDSAIDYRCAVYAHSQSLASVDFFAEILDGPRIFQWNFTGISATKTFCWDLDGVICTNPTVYDDDGEEYRYHIVNDVRPLYLPQVKVKGIVTNRIERWRPETEKWLHQFGVQYERLLMQPWRTASERREKSGPAEFKAEHLIRLGASAFIESHDGQAQRIAAITGRPVLSIESMRLFNGADQVNSIGPFDSALHVAAGHGTTTA
jgi:hypothetical protein